MWFRRIVAAILAVPLLYALAALGGSLIPANPGWQPPAQGIAIYIADNGVHTDLLLPANAEAVDWSDLIHPQDIADPRHADLPYLSFGWGDRDFYLNTPSWSEMRVDRVVRALAGGGATVLHVSHIPEPTASASIRRVVLRPEEYRRLAAYVRATFGPGPATQRGYGAADAFYAAKGGYSAFNTCNEWTGGALREAGVRVGWWTPFTISVMLWL